MHKKILTAILLLCLFVSIANDLFALPDSDFSSVQWNSWTDARSARRLLLCAQYASTFPHCSMKSTEYLWPKTKRLVKDERRSKSKLRVCA